MRCILHSDWRKYILTFELSIDVEPPLKPSQHANAGWENEKCCGKTSRRRVFPQLFRVLSAFGHRVAMCCDMLDVVGSVKFESGQIWANNTQHVAPRWLNMLRPTILRYVALASCERLAGALYMSSNLHLARKHTQIIARGHYLFREANSIPRALFEDNWELHKFIRKLWIFFF